MAAVIAECLIAADMTGFLLLLAAARWFDWLEERRDTREWDWERELADDTAPPQT